MLILKYIEKQQMLLLPHIPKVYSKRHEITIENSSMLSEADQPSMKDSKMEMAEAYLTHMDKKKYGAMLPKSGVYFIPDDKVVVFLQVLRELIKKHERN